MLGGDDTNSRSIPRRPISRHILSTRSPCSPTEKGGPHPSTSAKARPSIVAEVLLVWVVFPGYHTALSACPTLSPTTTAVSPIATWSNTLAEPTK